MCPVVRDVKNAVLNAYNNIHPRTLAETVGNPNTGRGSGIDDSPEEVYHRTYIDRASGKFITIVDRLS